MTIRSHPENPVPPLIAVMQEILATKEAKELTTDQYLKIEVSHEDGELIARAGIHTKSL